ncbi:MAG: universal stress protein [Rhizobacter sp.]|nr:universal stress protein [Rhizobacter sp.]
MYERILVPIDGSAPSSRGLQEAVAIGKELGSRLLLLHIVDNFPMLLEMAPAPAYAQTLALMRERGEEVLAKARSTVLAAGVEADTKLHDIQQETVADAILEQARQGNCQLIVMGTHGRRGMKRLALGSDAELVLRASPVPVLLVREKDQEG